MCCQKVDAIHNVLEGRYTTITTPGHVINVPVIRID